MTDERASIARCITLLEEQGKDIAEIKTAVKEQNGRVSSLERAHERLKAFGFFAVIGIGLFVDWFKRKVGLS